jgi:RHS repeat-associated protein
LPSQSFTSIGNSGFVGLQMDVSVGSHRLESAHPLLGISYGWADYHEDRYPFQRIDAYSYTSGACYATRSAGTQIAVSPATISQPIGSEACVTATVTDGEGEPVGGAGLVFTTTGVSSKRAFLATAADGTANFCYVGSTQGSDLLSASVEDSAAQATVSWTADGPNQRPIMASIPDQQITQPANTVLLSGSATDDGLPAGSSLAFSWTQIDGPAPVPFAAGNQAITNATFTQPGIYSLRLEVTDGELTASRTTSVRVFPPNQPPVVNPGPDRVGIPSTYTALSGTVSDDGLPQGAVLNAQWSTVSGPGRVNIPNPNLASTNAVFVTPGQYVMQLSASDSQFTVARTMMVTIPAPNEGPTADAGPDQTVFLPNPAYLSATASDDGLPTGSSLSYSWSRFSGPGTVSFSAPNQLSTTASFSSPGMYVLNLLVTDGIASYNDRIQVTAVQPSGPPPQITFTLPNDLEITKPTALTGSVTTGTYRVEYRLVAEDNSQPWTQFATSTGPVTNGTLATFDPTNLLNGQYELRLTATDTQGQISSARESVTVSRNMKLGHFAISFADLRLSMPGLPLEIVRSYDSRERRSLDFGFGWTLDVKGARLQKTKDLGRGWEQTVQWVGMFPRYCLQPTRKHQVTITFPDGRVYKFELAPTPSCQLAGPIEAPVMNFTQIATGSATTGASLAVVGDADAIVAGAIPGPVDLVGFNADYVNPTRYRLTTAEGNIYVVDERLGVTEMRDANGNTLTINANGVVHSAGRSVLFRRDSQGRITSVTDPAGQTIYYAYSDGGDLATFVDLSGNITSFNYANASGITNSTHLLSTIVDPRNVTVLQNFWNTVTRQLQSTADGRGLSTTYTHDVPNRRETIRDRLGNNTVYEFDDAGNVVRITDANSGVTTKTYDANDNLLTSTDPLGKTTRYTYDTHGNRTSEEDPLFNRTEYTYNVRKQLLTVKDALGRVTTNTYDPSTGNMLSTRDALGNVTATTYFSNGLPRTVVDAKQGVTSFEYDSNGNLTKQIDALGNASTYTYDSHGNKRSKKVTRTINGVVEELTTTYDYDANGRLTRTTLPNETFTRTVYNAIGKPAETYDALDRKTEYQYDNNGLLSRVTYPDLTFEAYTYDAEGRRTSTRNRANQFTNIEYDRLGRLTRTTVPDNTTTRSVYDLAGQLIETYDQLNHRTTYGYDDAGRRIRITNALNQTTTFGYDTNGNQTSTTDALGRTTSYVYDELGRRTRTVYHDQTFEDVEYDELGRQTSKRDQAGKLTLYAYDALGRLTSVTQYLQQDTPQEQALITNYVYDELGNRTSQTDANQHTTSFAHDSLGRRVKRILPLGQIETYTYDPAGNLATKTDFNGRTTTYNYDSLNRLLTKSADPYFSSGACSGGACGATQVGFTYDALGRRAAMSDDSGTTTYSYQLSGRLGTKAAPQGTLTYFYDSTYNVTRVSSGNTNGVLINYTYDVLNRLATASGDAGFVLNPAITYAYDAAGNLDSVIYPNGVRHQYTYNALNRLTNLAVRCGTTAPGCVTNSATYAYTLGAAGNRTSVNELNGRSVGYGYDDLYRLTSETIAGAAFQNGAITYGYDAVGNRTAMTSTVPNVVAPGLLNYDANDRLTSDAAEQYDANGNTAESAGTLNVYDFENRLVRRGSIAITYDGDGNRVAKTVSGITTRYLVDTNSVTGYAQVLEEQQNTLAAPATFNVVRRYTYGLDLTSQIQLIGGSFRLSYYGYDGHGSVRQLTNATGAVTDTFAYDAFGTLLERTGSTPNQYLYAGEQFDPDLGLYYNRARYLDVRTGRFWGMDEWEGDPAVPASLNKYLYAEANPANLLDPSGKFVSVGEITAVASINQILLSNQFSIGFDAVTELLFRDNAEAKTLILAGTAVISVAGLSALALRLTRSSWLTRYLARKGVQKQGPGVFVKVTESMSARASAYQSQISGRAAGEVYVVNGVKFDGFVDGALIDAKGPGYANFTKDGEFAGWFQGQFSLRKQAEDQIRVADGVPVVWHVAEESAAKVFEKLLDGTGVRIVHTPPNP